MGMMLSQAQLLQILLMKQLWELIQLIKPNNKIYNQWIQINLSHRLVDLLELDQLIQVYRAKND